MAFYLPNVREGDLEFVLPSEWLGRGLVKWSLEEWETINLPLDILKQRSCDSKSLASSLNFRPKWYSCLLSRPPRLSPCSFLLHPPPQLLEESMFFPCGLYLWDLTSLLCLLWQHKAHKDEGQRNISFSEMRWERFLRKRKSIPLCMRKTFFFSDAISSCFPHQFLSYYQEHLTPLENCLLQIAGTQFPSCVGLPIRGQTSLMLVHWAQVLAAKVLQETSLYPLLPVTSLRHPYALWPGFCLHYSIETAPVRITIHLFVANSVLIFLNSLPHYHVSLKPSLPLLQSCSLFSTFCPRKLDTSHGFLFFLLTPWQFYPGL